MIADPSQRVARAAQRILLVRLPGCRANELQKIIQESPEQSALAALRALARLSKYDLLENLLLALRRDSTRLRKEATAALQRWLWRLNRSQPDLAPDVRMRLRVLFPEVAHHLPATISEELAALRI